MACRSSGAASATPPVTSSRSSPAGSFSTSYLITFERNVETIVGLHFALCGSSARKVKRGAANLLRGRAMRYELHGLTAAELGREFDLDRMLNHGYLPLICQASRPKRTVGQWD